MLCCADLEVRHRRDGDGFEETRKAYPVQEEGDKAIILMDKVCNIMIFLSFTCTVKPFGMNTPKADIKQSKGQKLFAQFLELLPNKGLPPSHWSQSSADKRAGSAAGWQ